MAQWQPQSASVAETFAQAWMSKERFRDLERDPMDPAVRVHVEAGGESRADDPDPDRVLHAAEEA